MKMSMKLRQNKKSEIIFFRKFRNLDYDIFSEDGYARLLIEFENLVRPKKNEKLAEFGCGTGAFGKRLTKYGLYVTGIDISPESISFAKSHSGNIDFLLGDIEKTGLKDESFDIVVFSGVLHHFLDFSEAIREGYRVLKPLGRIFAYDPNRLNPIMWLYRDKKSPLHSTKGRTENERLLTKGELERALIINKFSNVKIEPLSGVAFKYVESNLGMKFLPIYNKFESLLGKTFLGRKIGSFLISYGEKGKV